MLTYKVELAYHILKACPHWDNWEVLAEGCKHKIYIGAQNVEEARGMVMRNERLEEQRRVGREQEDGRHPPPPRSAEEELAEDEDDGEEEDVGYRVPPPHSAPPTPPPPSPPRVDPVARGCCVCPNVGRCQCCACHYPG